MLNNIKQFQSVRFLAVFLCTAILALTVNTQRADAQPTTSPKACTTGELTLTCPDGKVLQGIESDGKATCAAATCPAGQVLVGINQHGDPNCIDASGIGGGSGGNNIGWVRVSDLSAHDEAEVRTASGSTFLVYSDGGNHDPQKICQDAGFSKATGACRASDGSAHFSGSIVGTNYGSDWKVGCLFGAAHNQSYFDLDGELLCAGGSGGSSVSGITCADGEYLQGIDDDGDPICRTLNVAAPEPRVEHESCSGANRCTVECPDNLEITSHSCQSQQGADGVRGCRVGSRGQNVRFRESWCNGDFDILECRTTSNSSHFSDTVRGYITCEEN